MYKGITPRRGVNAVVKLFDPIVLLQDCRRPNASSPSPSSGTCYVEFHYFLDVNKIDIQTLLFQKDNGN